MSDTISQRIHPATALLTLFQEVEIDAREGRIEGTATEALGRAFREYVEGGWQRLPERYLAGYLDIHRDQKRDMLGTSARLAKSAQYIWDEAVDWSDPASVARFSAWIPGLVARLTYSLVASRLLGRTEEEIRLEADFAAEMLRTAAWVSALRTYMGRTGLSAEDAAPVAFAAAMVAMKGGTAGQNAPTSLLFAGERLSIQAERDTFAAIIDPTLIAETETATAAALPKALDVALSMDDLPGLDLAASFESIALKIDPKHAMERVVEALVQARREIDGTDYMGPDKLLEFLRTGFGPAAERLGSHLQWGKAIHRQYDEVREHVERERKKEQEYAERQRGKDTTKPADVVYPIPKGIDGVTCFGLFLEDSIRHGDPLSLAWSSITDWGEKPSEGGFVLGPREQRELIDMTLYAGLKYATTHSVGEDPLVQKIIDNTGSAFLRERFRDIELRLRALPHLDDEGMVSEARRQMEHLADTGTIRKDDISKHLRAAEGMIDRIRAHSEVRRLLAHMSVMNTLPKSQLQDFDQLPHARRHAERADQHLLWLARSFTGQTRLELMNEAIDRVREYRQTARGEDFDAQSFDGPGDRWSDDLARRLGRFNPPNRKRKQKAEADTARTPEAVTFPKYTQR